MHTIRNLGRRLAPGLAVLALAASGCSTFFSSKKLDMQPFAENTVTTIGELRRLEQPPVWVRLRAYQRHPTVLEVQQEHKPFRELLRGVSGYSLQVVALNDSRIPEERKGRELVRYLRETSQRAVAEEAETELGLTPARLEEVLKEIAARKTMLEALRAAEPIVAAVLNRGLVLSDRVGAAIGKAAATIEGEVQTLYAPMLANRTALVDLQEKAMWALALAEKAQLGDQAAHEELRRNVPVARDLPPADRKPPAKELQAVVTALAAQLDRIHVALQQINPEYEAYRESLTELDTLRNRATERARAERGVLMLWARSHRNLGNGVEVPPAFDVAKILASTASSAVKGIVPF